MYFDFQGKKISGILSVLPENEYLFEDETTNPESVKNRRLKKIIGFGKRRRVKADTVISDMFLHGLNYLFDTGKIKRDEIGAVIVATLSPDYWLPPVSSILQGESGLSKDVFCMDIPCGCAGFVLGLIQSFMLLDHMTDKKVILCTGEIFNRKTDPDEPLREAPSFGGDIANITIVENAPDESKIACSIYNNGRDRNALQILDGAFKNPMTADKIQMQTSRLPHTMVSMDGSQVFNFAQKEVPPAVREEVKRAGYTMDQVDYFLFHQPNHFMLQKLAEQLKVPFEKMPMNLTTEYGNSDSGTIPAVATLYAANDLLCKDNVCCFCGFGSGLTWATIVMNVSKMDFCENLESNL